MNQPYPPRTLLDRLLLADKSEAERERIRQGVFDCWPFSPELLDLLEDHILLSAAAEVNAGGNNIPHDRELISDIWMHSMSPARNAEVTPAQLHLDITRQCPIDDNAFQSEITILYDNIVNIHGGEIPGGPLWFSLGENPRSKVRACQKLRQDRELWSWLKL